MPALLLDLDGCVYQEGSPLPGAVATLRWLREQGIDHAFVTNTTSRGPSALLDRLRGMGIEADPGQVLTPTVAASLWIRENRAEPAALFVPAAAHEAFEGLARVSDGAESGAGAVVVGDLVEGWTFGELNRAFRLLMADPSTALVALGLTRYWKVSDGLQLDVGPFVAALQFATGREPVVLGKPAAAFFALAAQRLGAAVEDVVMVGDDIRSDVEGAQRAGCRGVLVRTGKFAPGDLERGVQPDAVLDSIADLPGRWPL